MQKKKRPSTLPPPPPQKPPPPPLTPTLLSTTRKLSTAAMWMSCRQLRDLREFANSNARPYHLRRPRQGQERVAIRCRHHTPSEGDSADAHLKTRPPTRPCCGAFIIAV